MQRITDVHIRNLKATDTTQKITIGDGLSLWVSPQGKKTWYLRYYTAGKRQIATIGEYPSLEALKRDREGQWSIRINRQWRICFIWENNHAYEVEIVDYH